ncbi:MAG TPA: hypothetical protein PKX38_00780 [Alphaproteobacteria bacterium]|jgi:hypothetical protein|nr:hypothetical protein [Micavibrio sp.]MBK9562553.1 hypothetical protein [Micavibrio sp.]HQX26451.1 hypothetical protein [Alphaproteobacteria bacterium]
MPIEKNIHFTENPLAADETGRYLSVHVRVPEIVKSWRGSLFSFEWLRPDGKIKSAAELNPAEREKRQAVEQLIQAGAAIPMPILGIGMMDNVEIGVGRAELLTLAAAGIETMPVHIPKSSESDFKPFRADVKSPA